MSQITIHETMVTGRGIMVLGFVRVLIVGPKVHFFDWGFMDLFILRFAFHFSSFN